MPIALSGSTPKWLPCSARGPARRARKRWPIWSFALSTSSPRGSDSGPGARTGGDMNLSIKSAALQLGRGQTLKVHDGAGSTICAHEGTVWITEENSGNDVLLEAGQCFRLQKRGTAVLQAFDDASVSFA